MKNSSTPSQAVPVPEGMTDGQIDTIVRIVPKLDRCRTPQQVLDITSRVQYTNKSVVVTIPPGGTDVEENVRVDFFKLNRFVSDDELAREYEERGLTPDPYAQAAVNEADPAFADKHPNGTHWKDAEGKWCSMTFFRLGDGLGVDVHRYYDTWFDYWWFGGVRRLST